MGVVAEWGWGVVCAGSILDRSKYRDTCERSISILGGIAILRSIEYRMNRCLPDDILAIFQVSSIESNIEDRMIRFLISNAPLRTRTLTLGIVVYRNNQYLFNYRAEKEHLPTHCGQLTRHLSLRHSCQFNR